MPKTRLPQGNPPAYAWRLSPRAHGRQAPKEAKMPYLMLQGLRKKAKQREELREAMEAEAGVITGNAGSARRKSAQTPRGRSGGNSGGNSGGMESGGRGRGGSRYAARARCTLRFLRRFYLRTRRASDSPTRHCFVLARFAAVCTSVIAYFRACQPLMYEG